MFLVFRHALVPMLCSLGLLVSCSGQVEYDDGGRAALLAHIDRLRADVESAEDLRAIKKLQRAYGYFLDQGMWTDLAGLFADDAVASFPEGIFEGSDSIARHFYRNIGRVPEGEVGLVEGRLFTHLMMQPVVHVDAGNRTASGRWRAIAMHGQYGTSEAEWLEGIYNMRYVQEDGVWKILSLDYSPGFRDEYAGGWGDDPDAFPLNSPPLVRQADNLDPDKCRGYPEACIPRFHYQNPGTSDDARAWYSPPIIRQSWEADASEVAGLLHRSVLLGDEIAVENLQRVFGYYLDRGHWDQVADLFTADGTVEYGQMGIYRGRESIRGFLGLFGGPGPRPGWLFDNIQLQIIVDVAPDGRTAKARAHEWAMSGQYAQQGSGRWQVGVYENSFVKENGVWKIRNLLYFPDFITDYDKGWALDAKPAPAMSSQRPPDSFPSRLYAIYPSQHVPAFHYLNPVTGDALTYPLAGGPDSTLALEARVDDRPFVPEPANDVATAVTEAEHLIDRVQDYHELENLQNAYGYYLDKNLWNDLADLFATDGSMELAQRGVYRGRERVREFLHTVFGPEGPMEGRLGNHIHMQPVIHVSDDGQHARIRSRMLQQLSFNANPSMGGAIYVNEAVKEGGRWKFLSIHAYDTFTASYDGGWVKSPGTRLPGPSGDFPPDFPPTVNFELFPAVYDIPYHYANPVTGRQ